MHDSSSAVQVGGFLSRHSSTVRRRDVRRRLRDKLLRHLVTIAEEESNGGLQSHVLAGAELRKVSDEVMQLVSMMDGINRYRFEKEPQLLLAWETARHVRTGPQAQAGPEEVKPAV